MITMLDGGRYFEAPRWHDGRLWFVDCMTRTLLSATLADERQEHARFDDTPCGTGILPDGRIVVLTMNKKQLFAVADGQLSLYADLSAVAKGAIDDMIIDGRGRAWVGDLGFNMPPPPDRGAVGRILLVMPDGSARVVAEGLRFPTALPCRPITEDSSSRRWTPARSPTTTSRPTARFACAAGLGACRLPTAFVWIATAPSGSLHSPRTPSSASAATASELQRIAVPDRRALACALGGPDRKTLFCLSAATSYEELQTRQVVVADRCRRWWTRRDRGFRKGSTPTLPAP